MQLPLRELLHSIALLQPLSTHSHPSGYSTFVSLERESQYTERLPSFFLVIRDTRTKLRELDVH